MKLYLIVHKALRLFGRSIQAGVEDTADTELAKPSQTWAELIIDSTNILGRRTDT